MSVHVAWLRGINVGGRHRVLMADLRAAFMACGHADVATYIQSGNVVFRARGSSSSALERGIEAALAERFGFAIPALVRSLGQLRAIVHDAPPGFGEEPATFHSDVLFLKAPLTVPAAMRVVRLRDGVDAAWPGNGVIYFRRLSAQRTASRLSAVVSTPEYASMSIRNWATTTAVLRLAEGLTTV